MVDGSQVLELATSAAVITTVGMFLRFLHTKDSKVSEAHKLFTMNLKSIIDQQNFQMKRFDKLTDVLERLETNITKLINFHANR
jgi:hypothetical protein